MCLERFDCKADNFTILKCFHLKKKVNHIYHEHIYNYHENSRTDFSHQD